MPNNIDRVLEMLQLKMNYATLSAANLNALEAICNRFVDVQIAYSKLAKKYEGSNVSYRDLHGLNQPTVWLPPMKHFDVHLDNSEGPRDTKIHFVLEGSAINLYQVDGGTFAILPQAANHVVLETDFK